jgi:hypothetical protein
MTLRLELSVLAILLTACATGQAKKPGDQQGIPVEGCNQLSEVLWKSIHDLDEEDDVWQRERNGTPFHTKRRVSVQHPTCCRSSRDQLREYSVARSSSGLG